MKITFFYSASLSGLLLAGQTMAATDVTTGRNAELSVVQQATSQFAESDQTPTSTMPATVVQAESTDSIGPGRYRFSVLAGTPGTKNYVNGTGAAARFFSPGGIAVDASGNVYISEPDLDIIRKITPDGAVTTFAGSVGLVGSQDGMRLAARFSYPLGLAVDGAGNLFVADYGNGTIRKIDTSGNVTTVAGTPGAQGDVDGAREVARLYNPSYLAVDSAGNLFVTQDALVFEDLPGPHALIRQVTNDGTVSSIAVPSDYYGPEQICVDREGNVYVSTTFSGWGEYNVVLRLTPTGETGKYDASELEPPGGYYGEVLGISTDQNGSLLIRSAGDPFHIYTPSSGWQTRYPAGVSDLNSIKQLAIGKSGELYTIPISYSDQMGAVEVGVFDPEAVGPVIMTQPRDVTINLGSSAGFRVDAVGGPALTYQWYFDSTPINGATSNYFTIQETQAADRGRHYSVVVTDDAGSITSNMASLFLVFASTSGSGSSNSGTASSGSGTGTSSSTSGSVTGSSGAGSASPGGGGSLDPRSSLAVLLLLAAKAVRRRAIKRESVIGQ